MIRATHGFHHGLYYFECEMNECDNEVSYARVGWSTRFGELQAPVGYDLNSFGFCSGDGPSAPPFLI
jgi:Set1/Ash2 histone methyltransferase complex subunit ASH2